MSFEVRFDGIYAVLEDGVPQRICSPFEVIAESRDSEGDNWGWLLKWDDGDGTRHEEVMHKAWLATSDRDVLTRLLKGGLVIEPDMQKAVMRYIHSQHPARRVTITQETGWHKDVFVLPDTILKSERNALEIRYSPAQDPGEQYYGEKGTTDDWKREVGELCRNNSRAIYSVSNSFAGPTLQLVAEEGGGSHFFGLTSEGKSTLLHAAASVFGGGGQTGFVKTWRTTSNGLELVASAHNDCCLILDELGQIDPKDAIYVAYTLTGGQSKSRMKSDGSGQQRRTWRLQFLSSGEITMEQLAESAQKKTRGGMQVRMIDIPANAGMGHGVWEDLHGFANGKEFSDELRAATGTHYGAVGRRWLDYLVSDPAAYAGWLKKEIRAFEQKYMPKKASPEVGRVVHRFAIVAAAGELATALDLTAWAEGEAIVAAKTCLTAWLEHRGGGEKKHDTEQMIRQVRLFLERHRDYGFHPIGSALELTVSASPIRYFKGYRKRQDERMIYCITPEIFKADVCTGFDHIQVLDALKVGGHLEFNGKRRDFQISLPGGTRTRCFGIRDSIFTNDDVDGE